MSEPFHKEGEKKKGKLKESARIISILCWSMVHVIALGIEIRCFSNYCQPLLEFLMDLLPGEKVILVSHGMGGVCISLAMEKFPTKIAVAVFVTAFMPGPGFPLTTVLEENSSRKAHFPQVDDGE
ncbi:UNVERIFIED_CONTAM: Methylesterase 10 [Sesamum calycinum]|uniref:Methylesterase 10 n=1 Tax=Sesamum calycinum TaxID=2727403 RepID=A0AAW2MLM1_9LAMI